MHLSRIRLVVGPLVLAVMSFGVLTGCGDDGSASHEHDQGHQHDHDHDHAHEHESEVAEVFEEVDPEVQAAMDAIPADYPLKVCVVSGKPLGGMGAPVALEHEGRTAYICCAPCEKKFRLDPAKYMAKIDEAKTTVEQ